MLHGTTLDSSFSDASMSANLHTRARCFEAASAEARLYSSRIIGNTNRDSERHVQPLRGVYRGLQRALTVGLMLLGGLLAGCQEMASEQPVPLDTGGPVADLPVPKEGFVKVQHVLIGFTGSVRGKEITRTQEEAEALANEILEKAKNGEDFAGLVEANTDDSAPGIYVMADMGVDKMLYPDEVFGRSEMVVSFGDVAFGLQPGEIGLATYDAKKSPFGWHIIKRLE